MEQKRKISTFEASSIIAGNGIGSGIMAIPFFIYNAGIVNGIIAFILAYIVSVLLHFMIAEILIKNNNTADILSAFDTFLFKGKFKNIYKISFFAIMIIVLITNLSAYISGASEIMINIINIPQYIIKILFYLLSAIIVVLGLKTISVSEKISISFMAAIMLILVVFSCLNININANIDIFNNVGTFLSAYSMIMFSFSAIFAVPQIVEGLDKDCKKIKKSIIIGLLLNLMLSVIVTICTIITSKNITDVAIIGWAEAVGGIVKILGSVFILIAMFTSYWSIGFATTNIIKEQTKFNFKLSFILATIPALLLTFIINNTFMDFMQIAGGAVAVIISLMVIPTYIKAIDNKETKIFSKLGKNKIIISFVFIMYILMAIGSFI